ncbi:MAG: MFS transporter [Myxococcota bacterium]
MEPDRTSAGAGRLSVSTKAVYATGDHTVNLVLSALSLLYLFFLTEFAGLRPALAGLVLWVARAVDAFTDPLMGRISDLTRLRAGRRRPYFLIGALPFGVFFALLWLTVPLESQGWRFAYYAFVYVMVSLSMTCLSVPYLALLPEMATDYDERTSLNTYRAAGAVLGTVVAASMKFLADALGGDAAAWRNVGLMIGVWCILPWFAVYRVSFERPDFRREARVSFREGARILLKHRAYRALSGLYILARIAVDLIGAMFLLYFTYWIGRGEDFTPTLLFFFLVVVLSYPAWLRVARRSDKRTIFVVGTAWWIGAQFFLFAAVPEWPRWTIFAVTGLAAIGYAVADLMPWAMLGDVIDEDELATGERREGVYVGFFMLLRKLGGATAVLLVGLVLDLGGYVGGVPREQQSEIALQTIRVVTSFAPALLLALAIWVARDYQLSRAAHAEILERLRRRRAGETASDSEAGLA